MSLPSAAEIEKYFDRLWPICRSITGEGVRESIRILHELIPLTVNEIPSGAEVFDWVVPPEWNVKEAYIITPAGERICDLRSNNLHLVGYSVAVNRKMRWSELESHLHTRPDLPNAIPYITSYYKPNWGFCLTHEEWTALPREGEYQVVIDSTHNPKGSLTYAECVLPGRSKKEILISSYLCHPSMANNELSGPLAAAFLFRHLAALPDRYYTYRLALTTETIGTLSFLAQRGEQLKQNLIAGYVLTCCGDSGSFTYKRSRQGNSPADFHAEHVLNNLPLTFNSRDFEPWGSDERQYCSPGFDLPVGVFMRTPYQEYPAYHTSLDNKEFISFDAMVESVEVLVKIAAEFEGDPVYMSTVQHGEAQLGKRNLYENLSESRNQSDQLRLRLKLLNFCDGKKGLRMFALKNKYEYDVVTAEATLLEQSGLLKSM